MSLNKEYWENRYAKNILGWDIGAISTPIKEYIDQLNNKELKILIPGAGKGFEAEYLFQNGFKNIFVLDIASKPLQEFKLRNPGFPEDQLIIGDFFKLDLHEFDLILEQTFFCSLLPKDRARYVLRITKLLKKSGLLAGLLFDFPLTENGPPFGGSMDEYKSLFTPFFKIKTLDRAYNSIPARQGNELFFIFEKK
jgi:thiopurine S-methyltransferase